MRGIRQTAGRMYRLYRDGFREMTVGRTLWAIILLKLFVLFAVLKWLFFPNFLAQFGDEQGRSDYVLEQLTTLEQQTSTP